LSIKPPASKEWYILGYLTMLSIATVHMESKGWMMNGELETIWMEAVVTYWRYYPGYFLEGLKKITEKRTLRINSDRAGVQTKLLPNTSLQLYG
jgi:hypothetical protein